METRRTLILKRIARESGDARRLRAALERVRTAVTPERCAPPERQFTTTGQASGKSKNPPPPP